MTSREFGVAEAELQRRRHTPARLALAYTARHEAALKLLEFSPALGIQGWAASQLATAAERLARENRRFQQSLRRIQRSLAELTNPETPSLPETLLEAMRSSLAVLCFENAWPGGAVKTERKGVASFTLTARGRAAHAGSEFFEGANAIAALAESCLQAARLTDRKSGITVNVGTISGGVHPNVVPDLAQASLDVRFRTVEEGERVARAIDSLASSDPRVSLEVAREGFYPPMERTEGVARLITIAAETAREMALPLSETATGGASEASFAAAMGLPTLDGLGPDSAGEHAVDEHVLISSVPERAALAAGLIERIPA